MANQLVIYQDADTTFAFVFENGKVCEIRLENPAIPQLVGNIYLGKVVRTLPSQKIAFVDIGESRTALLHFNDCQKPPAQGEKLMVQAIKAPIGDKGARLTTKIRLISHSLIYLPTEKQSVNISKKINNLQIREQLTNHLKDKVQGGVIVRTNAQNMAINELINEINHLDGLWHTIKKTKQDHRQKSSFLLHQELSLLFRIIRDKTDNETQIVLSDECANNVLAAFPHFSKNIIKNNNLYQEFNLKHHLNNALSRTIALPSGGFLVIDEVEAMTVIDVNAGTSNNAQKTNLEATVAIADTLRLKNLGGIIIIDFIDMPKSAQPSVIENLRLTTKNEPMLVKIYEFSQLGLLELTREREYLPLSQFLAKLT